jgi:hypothetical protein
MAKIRSVCPSCHFVNRSEKRSCLKCNEPLSEFHQKRYEDDEVIPEYEQVIFSSKPVVQTKVVRKSFCRNPKCQRPIFETDIYCKTCYSPVYASYFNQDYIPKRKVYLLFPNKNIPVVFNMDHEYEFGRESSGYEPIAHVATISRIHFRLQKTPKGFMVIDESRNGTWLNDLKLVRGIPTELKDGDVIKVLNSPSFKIQCKVVVRAD